MTREEALKMARMQAVMCGGVDTINGKKLTSKGGYWHLDGVKVTDTEKEVLAHIEIDEDYLKTLITE